ncbi:MAG: glycosyltransferase family 2 protein [Desulfovibrio sp.]|nr:glycosyltransferase family 2 protein [Desulfovibrio sp.]
MPDVNPLLSPLVSIVIPVCNKWELTRACLESLRQHTPGSDFEVIVADNGSADATRDECQPLGSALFPGRFRRLRFAQNLNFGPACNAGARAASGGLLLLLNNDTLLSPGWLPPLLAALGSDPRMGAVGPLLVYPEEPGLGVRVQHLGIVAEPQLYPQHLYEFFPAGHPLVRKKRAVQALTAAALLLPRALFLDCGGFCEEYRNGGEDVDLGLQITRRGLQQACVPESVVTHLTSQTPGRNDFEAHNALVLKRRCLKDFVPDLHFHAARDGYEVRLTAFLKPYLVLPERRAEVLQRRLAAGFDPDLCGEMLSREPLWFAGYALLAAHCEGRGDMAGACALRFLEAKFRPTVEVFRELLRLAKLSGNTKYADFAEKRLHWMLEVACPEVLLGAAREVAQYMALLEQPDMAALYRAWLAGPGAEASPRS